MAYARAKRHYRVAQEEAIKTKEKGMFISKNEEKKLLIFAGLVLFLVFLKGFLFGYLAGRHNS